MLIELRKFGRVLTSRESGREARAAFLFTLNTAGVDETIEVDFQGVAVLSPAWADEFLTPLEKDYKGKVHFLNTDNSSVKATLSFLSQISSNL